MKNEKCRDASRNHLIVNPGSTEGNRTMQQSAEGTNNQSSHRETISRRRNHLTIKL